MTNGDKSNEEDWKKSGICRQYPSYRLQSKLITSKGWLQHKQRDDGAEGLWRIHDTLYDFTAFISRHPGGSFWLEATRGTDITEAFEVHHLTTLPREMLGKYAIRKASKERNCKLTFHPDGFYRTLKSRVMKILPKLDQKPKQRTFLIHLMLLLATIILSLMAAHSSHPVWSFLAGLALCWLSISSHNYFHLKDNWQMYTFNLTLMNFTEWRISHALSHHLYPNSLLDLEMSLFEPMLCWLPHNHYASRLRRLVSVIGQPIIYMMIFPGQFLLRLLRSLLSLHNELFWHDAIGFLLPTLMLLVVADHHESTCLSVFGRWLTILLWASFLFGVIGLNAAHHGPSIYHDGDAVRQDLDWGLYQLDATIDRNDIKGSQFLVLTHFGEHILHHLFPTIDHGLLPQLYPVLWQTLDDFQEQLYQYPLIQHILQQNIQLLRTQPHQTAIHELRKDLKIFK